MRVFITGATGFVSSAPSYRNSSKPAIGCLKRRGSLGCGRQSRLPLAGNGSTGVILRIWPACGVEPPRRME